MNKADLEREEMIRNFLEEQYKKEQRENEEIESLVSNTDYIEWLKQFTQNKIGFSTNEWLYFPEKINEKDKENVEKFYLFYEGIRNYAQQNYIYLNSNEYGDFYRVKLDDFGFEIGVLDSLDKAHFLTKFQ